MQVQADTSARPEATSDRLHLSSANPVRVGMPELCRAGLSETWLWKACGHRHWLALARAHGLEELVFRNVDGERLYPAFTFVELLDGQLQKVREGCMLEFEVSITRIARTRFRSLIRVVCDHVPVATLTMETAFVRRAIEGSNRSATGGIVARPCGLLAPHTPLGRPFRPDGWEHHWGFVRAERATLATHLIDPTPHEDFNGADFLYFAAFQAMFDRAEWQWFRRLDPLLVTRARQIHFLGNIELGDEVRATLCSSIVRDSSLAHWTELARVSDDQVIAIAFAQRVAAVLSG